MRLESNIKNLEDNSPKCPNCGTLITTDYSNIKLEIEAIDKSISSKLSNEIDYKSKLTLIESSIDSINKEISDFTLSLIEPQLSKDKLNSLKQAQDRVGEYLAEIVDLNHSIDECQSSLSSIDTSLFDTLDSIIDHLSKIDVKLTLISNKNNLLSKYNSQKSELESVKSQIEQSKSFIDKIKLFINKMSIKDPNSIPTTLLKSLTSRLSNPELGIEFTTTSFYKNGNEKLDINCKYHGVSYDSCSAGERCMLSILILQIIIEVLGGVGLLILDENLSVLSEQNYNIATERISELEVTNILITSHMQGFEYYDSLITL